MRDLEGVPTEELMARAAEAALRDPSRDAENRWGFIRELHHRGELSVFQASASWCASPDPLLRCLGADVLGQLGCDVRYPFTSDSTPILNSLLRDPDQNVVSSALFALGHLGVGDLATICPLATHESADVRHSVAYCLGTREEATARDTLIALSRDADTDTRDWATFGLGSLSDVDNPAIREALATRLSDPDDEVRNEAILGLAVRGDRRAVPAILAEFEEESVSVLAIEAAEKLPDKAFIPRLEALLETNPDDTDIKLAIERCRAQ